MDQRKSSSIGGTTDMSENQCNHVTWLERIMPQFTDSPHWLMHDVDDGDPPDGTTSDNIFFDFCPMCGVDLNRK